MFIHKKNLTEFKNNQIFLKRKITWLCMRINSIMNVVIERETSQYGDIEKHLIDKVIVNKCNLTHTLYKTLKAEYKQLLKDFKEDNRSKIYTFVLYRIYTK